MQDATRRFTANDAKTMTPEQITAFWIDRQRANRAAGLPHHTTLVEPKTGKIIATID